ncbi:MAG: CYTH domain-containing protein [Candidatus Thiodiazotropha sp. (ex Monitilora ramsayi)]|nr:CYTH domain-containing protein [Candidatus Thiodiazotropha sp. (ex Monitilora ramsayi)]
MGLEIERKFLVINEQWKSHVESESRLKQGYLATQSNATIRVRISEKQAMLNIKGATSGIRRSEYEYEIPLQDAQEILDNLTEDSIIDKVRYQVRCDDHIWDLDVFHGDNAGLIVAEIELSTEDENFRVPEWAGLEVSGDVKYYNASLVRKPYKYWK